MCGITGYYSTSKKTGEADLKRMTDRLAHRGPDAAGYYFNEDKTIGLGHRRLSIIDLSEAANQPFYSQSGRYVTVFNGEAIIPDSGLMTCGEVGPQNRTARFWLG